MTYYGLIKSNELVEVNIIPIKAEGYDTQEITKTEYDKFTETYKQKQDNLNRLSALTNWFDNYFDKQLTQSIWQDDFEVSHDDYFNKDYVNIEELKAQAKLVRDEIRNLRK